MCLKRLRGRVSTRQVDRGVHNLEVSHVQLDMLSFGGEGPIRQQLLCVDLIRYPDGVALFSLVLKGGFGVVWSGLVGVLAAKDDPC